MFKIGCDPEFIILKNGSFISANKVLAMHSHFGLDGDLNVAEVRPMCANNSFMLVANLRSLFKTAFKKMPILKKNLTFLAGHFKQNYPIGGHIHISSPLLKQDKFEDLYNKLDAVLLTLSDIIDPLEERQKRWESGYGRGWRVAKHGGIEYLTPGSWLLTPQIAFVNLFLAETVAIEYLIGRNQIFDQFMEDKEISKQRAIVNFINKASVESEVKRVALKVIDKVFNLVPLNWNEDFKGGWI